MAQKRGWPRRIWYLSTAHPGSVREVPEDFAPLVGPDTRFDVTGLGYCGNLARIAILLRNLARYVRSDLILTEDYKTAIITSFLLFLNIRAGRHIIVGLNISSRPLVFRNPVLKRLMNRALQRTDAIIVASREEARIFHEMYGIAPERFVFIPWAYDLPDLRSTRFSQHPRPYFCLVGRNNRDVANFCSAVRALPADGIVISSDPPPSALPANVEWHENLSHADCIDCIRHAVANVVVVLDANRGAGHITIVTGMHCARPHIFSDVATVRDYLIDGEHGLSVPLHDAEALRGAMRRLLEDPVLVREMGRSAAAYAGRWLNHAHRRQLLRAFFAEWVASGRVVQPEGASPGHREPGAGSAPLLSSAS